MNLLGYVIKFNLKFIEWQLFHVIFRFCNLYYFNKLLPVSCSKPSFIQFSIYALNIWIYWLLHLLLYMRWPHENHCYLPSIYRKWEFFFKNILKGLPGQSCSVQFQTPPTHTLNEIIRLLITDIEKLY